SEVIDQSTGDGEQLVEQGGSVGRERLNHREDAPQLGLQHEMQQLVFAGEVVKEGALVQPNLVGEHLEAHAGRAVARAQAGGSRQDPLARRLLVARVWVCVRHRQPSANGPSRRRRSSSVMSSRKRRFRKSTRKSIAK